MKNYSFQSASDKFTGGPVYTVCVTTITNSLIETGDDKKEEKEFQEHISKFLFTKTDAPVRDKLKWILSELRKFFQYH